VISFISPGKLVQNCPQLHILKGRRRPFSWSFPSIRPVIHFSWSFPSVPSSIHGWHHIIILYNVKAEKLL
jgi:hypothetical protein